MKIFRVSLRFAVLFLMLCLLPPLRMSADIYSGEVMEYVGKEDGLSGETKSFQTPKGACGLPPTTAYACTTA